MQPQGFTNTSTSASCPSLDDLRRFVEKHRVEESRGDIWVGHPRSVDYVMRLMENLLRPTVQGFDYGPVQYLTEMLNSTGLVLRVAEGCPEFEDVHTGRLLWHAGGRFTLGSVDRFITYEESDLPWLLKLGLVKAEMEKRRVFYRLADWRKIQPMQIRLPVSWNPLIVNPPIVTFGGC